MNAWQHRVLALAAIAQAIALVKQMARFGSFRQPHFAKTVLDSVLNQNPTDFTDLYPQPADLQLGLEYLLLQIGPSRNKDVELTRYMVGVLALERKLNKNPAALKTLGERLAHIGRQRHQFQFSDDTVITSMAGTYSDVISPLGPPLKISGKQDVLQQPSAQHMIRALLLASIRNTVLWRQYGGKRRQFIFSRQRMVRVAQQLLRDIREHSEPQA